APRRRWSGRVPLRDLPRSGWPSLGRRSAPRLARVAAAERRLQSPSGKLVPDQLLRQRAGVYEPGEVEAGPDAHVREHRREVLGGEVPCGPGRVRTTAHPADAGVEGGDSELQGDETVRKCRAVGVVEVQRQHRRGDLAQEELENLTGLPRVSHPDGVAEGKLVAAD